MALDDDDRHRHGDDPRFRVGKLQIPLAADIAELVKRVVFVGTVDGEDDAAGNGQIQHVSRGDCRVGRSIIGVVHRENEFVGRTKAGSCIGPCINQDYAGIKPCKVDVGMNGRLGNRYRMEHRNRFDVIVKVFHFVFPP